MFDLHLIQDRRSIVRYKRDKKILVNLALKESTPRRVLARVRRVARTYSDLPVRRLQNLIHTLRSIAASVPSVPGSSSLVFRSTRSRASRRPRAHLRPERRSKRSRHALRRRDVRLLRIDPLHPSLISLLLRVAKAFDASSETRPSRSFVASSRRRRRARRVVVARDASRRATMRSLASHAP